MDMSFQYMLVGWCAANLVYFLRFSRTNFARVVNLVTFIIAVLFFISFIFLKV